MRKFSERTIDSSCWNKAREDEQVFVLLGRDPAAPAAIRAWVTKRLELGKNQSGDAQIQEALRLADQIAKEHPEREPMACGCPAGAHADVYNMLAGAAERDGRVCKLGWPIT